MKNKKNDRSPENTQFSVSMPRALHERIKAEGKRHGMQCSPFVAHWMGKLLDEMDAIRDAPRGPENANPSPVKRALKPNGRIGFSANSPVGERR